MAAKRTPRSFALEIGGTAVAAALSPRLLPRLPTRRRIARRVVLGTLVTWGLKEAMQPDRQARFAVQRAQHLREGKPDRVADLRTRLGREPTGAELVAFIDWEV